MENGCSSTFVDFKALQAFIILLKPVIHVIFILINKMPIELSFFI